MSLTGSVRAAANDGKTRRRLPGPQRRALILQAALHTFAAHGYDGAAMDEIAAAAGVSKAVVYDHVASKRDLYTQLLHAIRDEIERTVEEALSAPGASGEQRVRGAVEGIYAYVHDHPDASRLLMLELQGANVSDVGRELEERLNAQLARTLGDEGRLFEGHPRRARQLTILAELLKASVLGAVAWWYRHPEASRQDLVERTVEVVWPAIERALPGAVQPG
ncbi:MAG TPA: TetR/AcrR family transcriptional regulator [Conexibacter sp.]|nr:TetR/AcrR family transcriptional regulator [Conexibacter sp.]